MQDEGNLNLFCMFPNVPGDTIHTERHEYSTPDVGMLYNLRPREMVSGPCLLEFPCDLCYVCDMC
jgi:hypothetical protein